MSDRTAEPDLLTRLADLCVCAGKEQCLYCEARERIEAQDRTLRLAQEKMAGQQRQIARLEADCQRYAEAMEDEGHV